MTYLLAKRRSPWATAVLLLMALASIGGVYAIAASTTKATAASHGDASTQIEAGHKLFLEGCSSCHGWKAEGGFQPGGEIAGPSLIGVGPAAVDFMLSTGRMPLANLGSQALAKDPVYSEEEIAALAAYIGSLAPGPAIPGEEQYDTTGITAEQLALGGELFRANCASCHSFSGKGGALSDGKYAPALTDATPRLIYEAMITGPQNMPMFPDSTMRPEDKRAIIAYIETIREQPNNGGVDLGRLGPVTEGLLFFIVGLGALIAVAVWIGVKAK